MYNFFKSIWKNKKIICSVFFFGTLLIISPFLVSNCSSKEVPTKEGYHISGNPTFSATDDSLPITETKNGNPTTDLVISVSENTYVKIENNALVWDSARRPLNNNMSVEISGYLSGTLCDSFSVGLLGKQNFYRVTGDAKFSIYSSSMLITQTNNGSPSNDLDITVSTNDYVKVINNNELVWKNSVRPSDNTNSIHIAGMLYGKEYDGFNVLLYHPSASLSVVINPVPPYVEAICNQNGSYKFTAQDNIGEPLINPSWTINYCNGKKFFSIDSAGLLTWNSTLPPPLDNNVYLLEIECNGTGLAPATTVLTVKISSQPGYSVIPFYLLSIQDGILKSHADISLYDTLIIPSNVTSISDDVFNGCASLLNVDFGTFNGTIGANAFANCPILNSVKFKGMSSGIIGTSAFANCPFLTSVDLSNFNSGTIGTNAFANCHSLTSISLTSLSTGTINSGAFSGTSSLVYSQLSFPVSGTKYATVNGTYGKALIDKTTSKVVDNLAAGRLYWTEVYSATGWTSIPANVFQNSLCLTSFNFLSQDIPDNAFKGCINLNSAIFIYDISNVGKSAFENCTSLESADLSKITSSVGESAFKDCSSLKSTGDASSASSIGKTAFENCTSIVSTNLASATSNIGESAFKNCSSLKNIGTLTSSSIGKSAFENCTSLTSANLSSYSADINDSTFKNCSSLATVNLSSNFNKNIGTSAFMGCSSLTTISNLSNLSTANIKEESFKYCTSLTTVSLPNLTSGNLGDSAFSDCTSLTSLNISALTSGTIGSDCFKSCRLDRTLTTLPSNSSKYIQRLGTSSKILKTRSTAVSNIVGKIAMGDVTWEDIVSDNGRMSSYLSETIPYSYTSITQLDLTTWRPTTISWSTYNSFIPEDYFSNCPLLKKLILPNIDLGDSGNIWKNAFENCTALEEVDTKQWCSAIFGSVFSGCTSLNKIDLRKSPEIGKHSFEGCPLNNVQYPSSGKYRLVTGANGKAFINTTDKIVAGSIAIGSLTWQELNTQAGITNIVPDAFSHCPITSLNLSNASNISIGTNAFEGCPSLSTINFSGTNVTSIGANAFSNCTSLLSLNFANSNVTSIGDNAFSNCTSLTTLTLSNSNVVSIGNTVFSGCASLQSLTLNSINSIPAQTFMNCSSLFSFNLNSTTNLTSIGDEAFKGCTSISFLDFLPYFNGTIGKNVFLNCVSLTSISMPAYTGSISNEMFKGLTTVTYINLPLVNSAIGESAFEGCASLQTINLPGLTTASIGKNSFKDCTSLVNLSIQNFTGSIGESAFQNCASLTNVDNMLLCSSIGKSAFQNCTSLLSIDLTFYNGNIAQSAFQNCTSLTTLNLSKLNSKTISTSAFAGCYSITTIYAVLSSFTTSWADDIFSNLSPYGEIFNSGTLSANDTLAFFAARGLNTTLWDVTI